MKKKHIKLCILIFVCVIAFAALFAVLSRDYSVEKTSEGVFEYIELLDKKYEPLPYGYVIKTEVSDQTYKHIYKRNEKSIFKIDYPLYAHLFENDPNHTFMFLDSKKPHLNIDSRYYYMKLGTNTPELKPENIESVDVYLNDNPDSTGCGELVETITDRKIIDEVFDKYIDDDFVCHDDQSNDEKYDVYLNFKDSILSYYFGTISQKIYNIVWLNKKVEFK